MINCPHQDCNYKAELMEDMEAHYETDHLSPPLHNTWTVKYQYQLPGTLEPGEVYTEYVTARLCNIVDGHLVFSDARFCLLRAFAPGRWIEVKLKDE